MELIAIKNENGKQLVSARELYVKLEITERFNSWFDRMLKYGFIENEDFTSVKSFAVVNNGAKKEVDEYLLVIDMAKQICMLQRSEVGARFRQYFIECEKRLKLTQVPKSYAEALLEAGRLALELEKQAPKVEYYEKVLNAPKLSTATEIAKDLSMSAVKMNKQLNDLGVIFKQGKTWHLYAEHEDKIPEYADYHISEFGQILKWTERGRQWIIDMLS